MKKYFKYIITVVLLVLCSLLVWNLYQKKNDNNEGREKLLCSIKIECTDILTDINLLKEEKRSLIPQDGVIYESAEVEFVEGETVFDVLKKVLKDKNIPFEYSNTPPYNTAYIEGINNIYVLDCGERSGWLYSVNNEEPMVACSDYVLENGDKITFTYKIKTY